MLEHPFIDDVFKASSREFIRGCHKYEEHRRILLRYRQTLRRAYHFMLDDDAVRLSVRLSQENSDKLQLWSILARLPYDTVWLEWDEYISLHEAEQLGLSPPDFKECSQEIGWLLQKDMDSDTRWYATEFTKVDGRVFIYPIVVVFDPDGDILKPVSGCIALNELTMSKLGLK